MSTYGDCERLWRETTVGRNGFLPFAGWVTNSMKRPWKNRLLVKFFLSYLAVVLVLFVLFFLYAGALVKDFHVSGLSAKMQQEAKILGPLLPLGLAGEPLDRICRELALDLGVRLTVVARDGKVLGDSDEQSRVMENHGSRA